MYARESLQIVQTESRFLVALFFFSLWGLLEEGIMSKVPCVFGEGLISLGGPSPPIRPLTALHWHFPGEGPGPKTRPSPFAPTAAPPTSSHSGNLSFSLSKHLPPQVHPFCRRTPMTLAHGPTFFRRQPGGTAIPESMCAPTIPSRVG